jgi:hypothetical protein
VAFDAFDAGVVRVCIGGWFFRMYVVAYLGAELGAVGPLPSLDPDEGEHHESEGEERPREQYPSSGGVLETKGLFEFAHYFVYVSSVNSITLN